MSVRDTLHKSSGKRSRCWVPVKAGGVPCRATCLVSLIKALKIVIEGGIGREATLVSKLFEPEQVCPAVYPHRKYPNKHVLYVCMYVYLSLSSVSFGKVVSLIR